MTPEELVPQVRQWLQQQLALHPEIRAEFLTEATDKLRVILHFPACMAELRIDRPGWAPYRFVCFEVLPLQDGAALRDLSWYDEEGDTVERIISQLQTKFSAALYLRETEGR